MRNRVHRQTGGATAAGLIARHPRQAVGFAVGSSAIAIICVNALFLQPDKHPSPLFAPRTSVVASTEPSAAPPTAPAAPAAKPAAIRAATPAAERPDPIGRLLAPDKRLRAVQRVLADFGYGQIKPTGLMNAETQEAIRSFETRHRMPASGQVSDQLVRALAQMSGQRLE